MNPPNCRRFSGTFMIVSFAACLATAPAIGAEWSNRYELSLRGGYDSNIRLRTEDPIHTPRSDVGVSIDLNRHTETLASTMSIRWQALHNDRAEFADSDDYFADVSVTKTNQRLISGLQFSASRMNTLVTEFDATGPVDLGIQRERLSGTAFAEWRSSERVSYVVSVGAEDTDFGESRALIGFRYLTTTVSRLSQLRPGLRLTVSGNYGELDAPDAGSTSSTVGIEIGLQQQLSESLSWEANIGRSQTDTLQRVRFAFLEFENEDSESGWLAGVGLNKSWQYSRLSVNAEQVIQPNGGGFLNERLSVSADWTHNLSDRFSITTLASQTRFTAVSQFDNQSVDVDFNRFGLRFDYRWSERITLRLEGSHDTLGQIGDVARRNTVFLRMSYAGGRS